MRKALGRWLTALLVALSSWVVPVVGSVEADERAFPHLHYTGDITVRDGGPVPGGWGLSAPDWNKLGPPGCVTRGFYELSSPTRYPIVIEIRNTNECLRAMQTFQPNPADFATPTKSGWIFQRR